MSPTNLCTKEAINAAADHCQWVIDHCSGQTSYLDFLHFHYCTLGETLPITILVSILFTFCVFNLFETTADRYLSPAMTTITQKLKMSENLTGVTLCALANGAVEVITGLVAGGHSDEGVPMAIGTLFGACLFAVTVILARTIQGGEVIKIDASAFKRDTVFLLIALFWTFCLAALDMITPLLAGGYFLIYVFYFAWVLYQEKQNPAATSRDKNVNRKSGYHQFIMSQAYQSLGRLDDLVSSHNFKSGVKADYAKLISVAPYSISNKAMLQSLHSGVQLKPINSIVEENGAEPLLPQEHAIPHHHAEPTGPPTLWTQIYKYYNVPLFFARDVTMITFEEDRYNFHMALITPFCSLMFVAWQTKFLGKYYASFAFWLVYFALSGSASYWIWNTGKDGTNLAKKMPTTFATITFLICLFWLGLIAHCFMDFLALLKILSGLPVTYLCLTVLAWGSVLDDFFVDYIIAKAGHGRLAVTGLYSGQLFNILIGFGGAMLMQSWHQTVHLNAFHFDAKTWKVNLLNILLVGCLAIVLITTLVTSKADRWVLQKRHMLIVLEIYAVFLLLATAIAFI